MSQRKARQQRGRSKPAEDRTSRTLFVGINNSQLPCASPVTKKNLRLHFQDFEDDLESCTLIYDKESQLPKFGFVTFESRDAAALAMEELHGTMLNGRHKLRISFKRANRKKSLPQPNLNETGFTSIKNNAASKPIVYCGMDFDFKDEVVALMIMEGGEGALKTFARQEKVEICPLPPPRLGFNMKGESMRVKSVQDACYKVSTTLAQTKVGYEQMILNVSYQPIITGAVEVDQCRKILKRDFKVVTMCSFDKSGYYQVGLRVTQNHVTFIKIVNGDIWTEQADAIVIPTGKAAADNQHSYPIEIPSLIRYGKFEKLINTTRELVEVGETMSLDSGVLPCFRIIQALCPLSALESDDESLDIVIRNSLSCAKEMNLGSITFPGIRSEMVTSIIDGLCSLGLTSLHTVTVVVGRSTIAYKTALIKEMCSPKATSTPAVSNSDFIWLWGEDDGSFTPYSTAATAALNMSYKANSNGTCQLNINGMRYNVNFALMKQVNLSTGNQRCIVKNVQPVGMKSQASSSGTRDGLLWKYRDDYNRFMSYSPADNVKIESMFQRQDESSRIVIQKRIYSFDFKLMKQVNVFTGFKRDIKREASYNSVASPVSPAVSCSSSKPDFLSNDNVVIHLKGPRENLATAKKQLEQKIKALMFGKVVPLSTKVPPSLHQHLQAIAKKHRISCRMGEEGGSTSEASNVYQHSIKLEGLESSVKAALVEVQGLILQFQASREELVGSIAQDMNYPLEWDPMSEKDLVKVIHLPSTSEECRTARTKFEETMPNACVIKVQRVQNKELWRRYIQCKSRMHEKNAGLVNEKFLLHGTRGEPVEKICKSEEGFDMRFSREGMWGQANYFAANASYSDTYSHLNPTTNLREMIVAKVLTGDSYYSTSDSSLRMPPEKQQSSTGDNQLQQVRYDSVNGKTSGSVVYMTYSNDRAYPAYIITYSRNVQAAYSQPVGYSRPAGYGNSPPLPLGAAGNSPPLGRTRAAGNSPPLGHAQPARNPQPGANTKTSSGDCIVL